MRPWPPPGSCCGFLYSAKITFHSVVAAHRFAGAAKRSRPDLIAAVRGRARYRRHWIVARTGKGLTAQQPRNRKACPAQGAVAFHRLQGVFRTGGNEPAGVRQHRRNPPLVTAQGELDGCLHFRFPLAGCPSCASRARSTANCNPRATSCATSANGRPRTDLRGLNITSTGPSCAGHELRTASRMRRLMRLRSTAPPRILPTVNPTRSEGSPSSSDAARRKKNTVMFPVNWRRPV